jgi:DNA-binding NarL/FixJ family response regulator
VAVVDIRMPPGPDGGIRAARTIRDRHPGVGVLVLSQYARPSYAFALLAEGADGAGYLLKDRVGDLAELTEALERVGRGGSVLDSAVVAQLVGRPRPAASPMSKLTAREREVLALMAEGRSNQAISERLVVTGRTVGKHVNPILGKLGIRADAVSGGHRGQRSRSRLPVGRCDRKRQRGTSIAHSTNLRHPGNHEQLIAALLPDVTAPRPTPETVLRCRRCRGQRHLRPPTRPTRSAHVDFPVESPLVSAAHPVLETHRGVTGGEHGDRRREQRSRVAEKLPRGRRPVPLQPQPRPPELEANIAQGDRTKVWDSRTTQQRALDTPGAARVLRDIRAPRRAPVLPNRHEGLPRVIQCGTEQQ